MFRKWFAVAVALTLSLSAHAQTSPGLVLGQVPTPAQWNSFFIAKQDALGFTPLNRAGGVMTGPLITVASTAVTTGFRLTPGVAPTAPVNGDLWATSQGLFTRTSGTTVGPLGPSGNVNTQSGATYTVLDSDRAKLIVLTNSGAVAVAIPQANATTFIDRWYTDVVYRGTGTATITATTSTINGLVGNFVRIQPNQSVRIFSDGANYYSLIGFGNYDASYLSSNAMPIQSGGLMREKWFQVDDTANGGFGLHVGRQWDINQSPSGNFVPAKRTDYQYWTVDDSATTAGHFSNGGVPIGETGGRFLSATQFYIYSNYALQGGSRPVYVLSFDGSGFITDVLPNPTPGCCYAPSVSTIPVYILAPTAGLYDSTSIKGVSDGTGTITGFIRTANGLPLSVGNPQPAPGGGGWPTAINQTQPMLDPPIPTSNALAMDVGPELWLVRNKPVGTDYYSAAGSIEASIGAAGPAQTAGVAAGTAFRWRILSRVVNDSLATGRAAMEFNTQANLVPDNGFRPRFTIGEGVYSPGQTDQGEGTASFAAYWISNLASIQSVPAGVQFLTLGATPLQLGTNSTANLQFSTTGGIDSSSMFRVTGATGAPLVGAGLQLSYAGGIGRIQPFNAAGSVNTDLIIAANSTIVQSVGTSYLFTAASLTADNAPDIGATGTRFGKGWFGAGDFAGQVLITDNTAGSSTLIVRTTEDSSIAAPNLILDRITASPAVGDALGSVQFRGLNSTSLPRAYASINATIVDTSTTTEDGRLDFFTMTAGTSTLSAQLGGAGGGLQLGTPTGGDRGLGTINVSTAIYKNNLEYPPPTRLISTTAPLAGGGDLSADRTLSITAAALTRVDDTNVTLTLGGSPSTALLAATSITAGWTGTLSPARGGTGVANNASSTLTISGAFGTTFTVSGATALTLPTSGTVATTSNNLSAFAATTSAQLLGVISDETGLGTLVFNTSPNLITPILGVAAATSVSLTGTAGAGFVGHVSQSSVPSAPASGYRDYADATGRRSWIRAADGFTRTWDATITANRVYTLPDATTTIAGLNIAQIFTVEQSITVNAAGATPLTLRTTDDTGISAPNLSFVRISSSPAAGDTIGGHQWQGTNSALGQVGYGQMLVSIEDPTAGSEDSKLDFYLFKAGVNTLVFSITNAGASFPSSNVSANGSGGFVSVISTSTSATSLVAGPAGATNPTFNVDSSVASAVTGWNVTGRAVTAGASLAVISSGTNEGGTIDAKGTGILALNAIATGPVAIGTTTTSAVSAALAGLFLGPNAVITGDRTIGGSNALIFSQNSYFDGTNHKYISTGQAANYYTVAGTHNYRVAASGTAGNNVTWINAMLIGVTGGMNIGTPTGGDKGLGTINVATGLYANNSAGLSTTKTVRAAGGASDCTLIYTMGLLTGGTC